MFPGMGGFDPSKLSPQAMTELTELMRSLNPSQLSQLQTIMHNAMAGFDVSKSVQEFESSLPPTFRERMARIMYLANGTELPAQNQSAAPAPIQDENAARLVILQSVAQKLMSPEEALKVLFP